MPSGMRFGLVLLVFSLSFNVFAKIERGWSAKKKQQHIEERCTSRPYGRLLPKWLARPGHIRAACGGAVAAVFALPTLRHSVNGNFSDNMSGWRYWTGGKFIHRIGANASCKVDFNNSKYSGILGSQGVLATIRVGLAAPRIWPFTGWIPGSAVKFHIDGDWARHLFTLHSLDGQGNDSVLVRYPYSTEFDNPKSLLVRPLNWIFGKVVTSPRRQELSGLADILQDNTAVDPDAVRAPWAIRLKSPDAIVKAYEATPWWWDFRSRLAKVTESASPENPLLYNIIEAQEEQGGEWEEIGRLSLTSPLIASSYGDNIWMNHQGFELIRPRDGEGEADEQAASSEG